MHILLIHQFFLGDNEGGGSRWNEMSKVWISQGHKVTVITGNRHYMEQRKRKLAGTYFNAAGARVIQCKVCGKSFAGFASRFLGYLSFLISATWAGLWSAREKYSLIIVTSPPLLAGIAGWLLARIKRIDYVLEIRDLWPESAIDLGILKNKHLIRLAFQLEKFLYDKALKLVVLTPAFREVLVKRKGIASEKIWLIPNAADFELAELAQLDFDRKLFRENLGLHEKLIFIYVGAHGLANDLDQILKAASQLRDTCAHFLLIGGGSEKKTLVASAAAQGLENVTFLDPVSKKEIFKYILAADVGLAVLKRADIFSTVYSNKTFDYFSCGKPVLLTIDGVSRELVEGADAGSFATPNELATRISLYLDHPELIRRQGKNGYRLAKRRFDRNVLAMQLLANLQNIS